MFPAATMDDQEKIAQEDGMDGIVLGAPAFSSPNPDTDNSRMLPLEDGTSAYEAGEAAATRRAAESLSDVKKDELVEIARSEDVPLPDGAEDHSDMKVDELKQAIRENRASGLRAKDFIEKVNASTDQTSLDAAVEEYEASGKNLSTVEKAIEKKQDDLDNPDN
jgi:hypothetical protein